MHQGLVDRIYEAGVLPELWPAVLDDVGRTVRGIGTVLLVPTAGRWIASGGLEAMVSDFVTSGLVADNPRTNRLLAEPRPGFISDLDIFTREELAAEPIYRDFLKPRGGGWGAATVVSVPSGDVLVIHAERSFDEGPFERPVVDMLDSLRPHFARSALLSARLNLERARSAVVALEQVGLPAAVLGRAGRTIAVNDLMAALMPEVVQDRPSRFALTNAAADRLFAECIAPLDAASISSIPIAADEDHPPTIVHVLPVRGAAHDVFSAADALVILTPVVPRDVPTAAVIQGLFDLTPAEAKVAGAVGNGKTLAEIASTFGISPETVRSHVKAVLSKTGLDRQAALVGLLRGIALPTSTQKGQQALIFREVTQTGDV